MFAVVCSQVIAPFLVAAKVDVTPKVDYYAREGEFCGTADNGEFHHCHGTLECVNAKCAPGTGGGEVGLAEPEGKPETIPGVSEPETYPGDVDGSHVVHVIHHVYHDAPQHGYHGYYDGGNSGVYYGGGSGYHNGYTTYHHPYYTNSYGSHYYGGSYSPQHPVYHIHGHKPAHYAPVNSPSSWTSVKLTDYTQEDQACGPTGLGVNQKPCAPWLACYKQVVRSGFLAVHANMQYSCKPKMVKLGQRCGRDKRYTSIDVGRCPAWSHCQEVAMTGGQLGGGVCTQTPLERVEDAVDPFHSSI